MKLIYALILAIGLAGCGGTFDVHKSDPAVTLTVPQKAQNAIDEANAAVAAAAQTVLAQTQAGAISKADEKDYADQLNKAAKALDASQAALKVGDLSTQAGQLQAAQALINALQAKLIAIKNGK